jgi:hypothetical protein
VMNFGQDAKFRRIELQNARKKRISAGALQLSDGVGR